MRVLEAKTDCIIRLLRRLETLDHKTDRVLELLERGPADVAARGVCDDPVSDVASGDVLMTDDLTDVKWSIADVAGGVKVEEDDFTVTGDVRSPEDVTAVSVQEDIAETDVTARIETTTLATGDIITNTGDLPPVTVDIATISGDVTTASDDVTAPSANLQAGNNSYLLMGLRNACSLLEARAAETAEDVTVLRRLRGRFCWAHTDAQFLSDIPIKMYRLIHTV